MFKESLTVMLNNTEDSLGAFIMGMDGIAVEKALRPEGEEANLDVAAAELASLVRSAQRMGRNVGLGEAQEINLSWGSVKLLARFIGTEYFLLLALPPEGNIGRGRYELRKAELKLEPEFHF